RTGQGNRQPATQRRPYAATFEMAGQTRRYSTPRIDIAFQALQVGANVRGALIPHVAVFLQCFFNDRLEPRVDGGIQALGRRCRAGQNRFSNLPRSLAGESLLARRHLVKHRAEAEQVSARIERFAPRLLRRHVGRRPHRRTGDRQIFAVDGKRGSVLRGHALTRLATLGTLPDSWGPMDPLGVRKSDSPKGARAALDCWL